MDDEQKKNRMGSDDDVVSSVRIAGFRTGKVQADGRRRSGLDGRNGQAVRDRLHRRTGNEPSVGVL